MCNAGALSMATQGVGAIGGATASIFGASADKRAYDLKAYFDQMNADAATADAREALRTGNEAQTRYMLETGQLKASQRAAIAANGVDPTTGSALDRLVSTDFISEVDRNTIAANAAREAAGFRSKAVGLRGEAGIYRAARDGINPMLTGVTSLLGSAKGLSNNWYNLRKEGAFSKGYGKSSPYGGNLGPIY